MYNSQPKQQNSIYRNISKGFPKPSLFVYLFVNSFETVECNKLKLLGMIFLGGADGFKRKNFHIEPTVHRKIEKETIACAVLNINASTPFLLSNVNVMYTLNSI